MEVQRLQQLLNGNLNLFDQFYEETKASIFYNICSFIDDKNLVEDILQETYIKFLNNLHRLKVDKNPVGYLFLISKNLSLNELKKRKKEVSLKDDQVSTN